jgi:hypothetical protein
LPFDTDERLKGYLDTNQLHREQICRAVLAIDKRFTNVVPRHPRGGPDAGRDIEALFRGDQRTFGAVGFVNQASDAPSHKRAIKKKFGEDLASALDTDPKPDAFVFMTNLNLTVGEKEELETTAKTAGVAYCEIFDRERLRIALDSPDGFAIRYQYLHIPLSEPEQATFFAKWGDDIQSVISTGFQRVERTLDRILFLQESTDVLSVLTLRFELDRAYPADEIGHFRACCLLHLKEPKLQIFGVLFGSSDNSNRMREDAGARPERPGIKHGMSGFQWEEQIAPDTDDASESTASETERPRYTLVGSSRSVGMDPVPSIWITYSHDPSFFRFFPRMNLRDVDQAWFMPILNSSLADRLKTIHVYANGYKLQEIGKGDFSIDATPFDADIPLEFTQDELADPWVRIRPRGSSTFEISFSRHTPRRLFTSPQTPDSLAKVGSGGG